jgi:hypothetical protein
VIRKKAIGDWRHWFTEEDVEVFKPAYLPYMELIGYDCNDWAISSKPVIEPEYSSIYMQSLPLRKPLDSIRWLMDTTVRRLVKRG